MRFLVTGGAGFIGSHLVDRLLSLGGQVRVVDDMSNGLPENVNPEADLVVTKVEGEYARKLVMDAPPDVIFHLAARGSIPFSVAHPEVTFDSNVLGCQNMMHAAVDAGVRHFVFSSSASWYGDRPENPDIGPVAKVEDMEPRPKNHYAVSKAFGELWGMAFHRMHGLPFTALRFFNVFGPRQRPDSQYAAVVPKFIHAALNGGVMELHGGGDQTRDLTYVDNVVDAAIAACDPKNAAQTSGQVFNVCAGVPVSIRGLAEEVCKVAGISADDADEMMQVTPTRKGDIKHSFGSSSKLTAATGWKPGVRWNDGIRRTIDRWPL